jgi:hypothetical protein
MMKIIKTINKYGSSYLMVILLFCLFTFIHFLAKIKVDNFLMANIDRKTIKNIALYEFIDSHLYLTIIYAAIIFFVILISQLRKFPKFVTSLSVLMLLVPCFMYSNVCAYLATKIISTDLL